MNRNITHPARITRRARLLEQLLKLNLRQSNQAKCSLAMATQRTISLQDTLTLIARTTSKAAQLHSLTETHTLLTAHDITASLLPYKLEKTTQLLAATREHSSISQKLCSLKNTESSLSARLQRIQLQKLAIAEHIENSDIEDSRASRQANSNPFQNNKDFRL